MAPGTAAPIRDPSRNSFKSPLKKAARRIVTAPTFNVIRTIDFDKKSEYEKFIQFIDSSNKELAKIKLKKPEIDSRLASILPLYLPDMTTMSVQGKSLQLSWFKRILENWKKFTKWFKSKSRIGRWSRNQLARWKKIQRKIKNLLKRIKSIKWKDLLSRIKNSWIGKIIKDLKNWIKKPNKFPKWPKDMFKGLKDAFDKLKNIDVKKILQRASWVKAIANVVLGKATPWGLVATTIVSDVMNNPANAYDEFTGSNAYFNDPFLQKTGPFKVEDVYNEIMLRQGKEIANNLELLKESGMEADLLERYAKFLKEKNRVQEEYSSKYSNLNTKSSIDTEIAEMKEEILRISREQLYIHNNPGEMINEGRVWTRNRDELIELLDKSSYLKFKKREFYNKLDTNNQSNIKSNNNFDLSQIYSMDFDSSSTFFNNAPQLYVMESKGETKYVPFTAGASSNNSLSLYNEIDYSQFNSKLLDELRFIKLSSG